MKGYAGDAPDRTRSVGAWLILALCVGFGMGLVEPPATTHSPVLETASHGAFDGGQSASYATHSPADAAMPGLFPEAPHSTLAGLSRPVSGPVSSGFGLRGGRVHEGIDIVVPYGTPVRSAGDGVVSYAGYAPGYGNLVIVRHSGDVETWYGHLSRISVKVGQSVKKGAQLGRAGSTGHSTGPHLHFEVRVKGRSVDPFTICGG